MSECKAAKYNPANACADGKCKWPGVCNGVSESVKLPEPEQVTKEILEMVDAAELKDEPSVVDKPKRGRKPAK